MLSPGSHGIQPTLRFYYPASEVIVHSRGDRALPGAHAAMSWPVYDGRDLSSYATWRDWLGFFAPDLGEPFTAIYDEATQLGMVRVFPRDVARGAKLFGFGLGFGDVGAYTDDGSQYVEMWGGFTPTFWDYAELAPHGMITWFETWYPISRCAGLTTATTAAALNVRREADHLELDLFSPGEHQWTLRVMQGGKKIAEQPFQVNPAEPFRTQIALPGNRDAQVIVHIVDYEGNLVISYAL